MLKLIDGKQLAQKRQEEIKQTVEQLKAKGIVPGLAVILVGEDPASQVYVRNKEKACQEVGFYSEVYRLPEQTSQDELLQLIDRLNGGTSTFTVCWCSCRCLSILMNKR